MTYRKNSLGRAVVPLLVAILAGCASSMGSPRPATIKALNLNPDMPPTQVVVLPGRTYVHCAASGVPQNNVGCPFQIPSQIGWGRGYAICKVTYRLGSNIGPSQISYDPTDIIDKPGTPYPKFESVKLTLVAVAPDNLNPFGRGGSLELYDIGVTLLTGTVSDAIRRKYGCEMPTAAEVQTGHLPLPVQTVP